jgi:hypothetical protein
MNDFLNLIEVALNELEILVEKSKYLTCTHSQIINTKRVLSLLKTEISINSKQINTRVLRAMHDIGVYSFRYFENTQLEIAINDITNKLYDEIPVYEELKMLGSDFGNENPI